MPHPINPQLLELLQCPVTGGGLLPATPEILLILSAQNQMDAALISEDGSVAYPVRAGIPHLRPQDAIPMPL